MLETPTLGRRVMLFVLVSLGACEMNPTEPAVEKSTSRRIRITGVVTRSDIDQPLEGVTVELIAVVPVAGQPPCGLFSLCGYERPEYRELASAVTNSLGQFTLAGVWPNCDVFVAVEAPRFQPFWKNVRCVDGTEVVDVEMERHQLGWSFELPRLSDFSDSGPGGWPPGLPSPGWRAPLWCPATGGRIDVTETSLTSIGTRTPRSAISAFSASEARRSDNTQQPLPRLRSGLFLAQLRAGLDAPAWRRDFNKGKAVTAALEPT